MAYAEVVLLRDSCSAVAVFAEVHRNRRNTAVRSRLADCVLRDLVAEASLPVGNDAGEFSSLQLLYVGEASTGAACYIALPPAGRYFLDFTLPWARHAQYGQARQYMLSCRMAMLQTVGGGWASLRRADRALRYAIMLYETAALLDDTATLRKCRVFVGWAHLWNGDVGQAVDIFEQQRQVAQAEGDIIQERRCISAICHAQHSPSVIVADGGRGAGGFLLSESWVELFA